MRELAGEGRLAGFVHAEIVDTAPDGTEIARHEGWFDEHWQPVTDQERIAAYRQCCDCDRCRAERRD